VKRFLIIAGIVVAAAGLAIGSDYWIRSRQPAATDNPQIAMNEAQARVIAEKTCIRGGETLEPGYYNEGTKTWWFDANLNNKQPGCNPACVVSESDKTAEINWRCTGAIVPEETTAEYFARIFVEKYPKYADTLTIKINKEDSSGVRGSISFVSGEPGGMFLATKVNGEWEIVYEGNGSVNCPELKQTYKLSADVLTGFCD
jgi:hypothetical protein